MAVSSQQVLIEVLAQTQQAVASLDQLNAKISSVGTTTETANKQAESASSRMADGYAMLAVKIAGIIGAFKTMYDEASKNNQAQLQLNLAIKNNTDLVERSGKSVNKLSGEYKKYAEERMKVTGIADDDTMSLMALLVQMKVAPDLIEGATTALQDMEASGIAGAGAAKALARALGDPIKDVGALQRMGIKLNETDLAGLDIKKQQIKIIEELTGRFSGQAEAVNEAGYGMKGFMTMLGDVAETIGKVIFPVIQRILEPIKDLIGGFLEMDPPIQKLIILLGGLALAFTGPLGVITGLIIAITTLIDLLGLGSVSAAQLKLEMNNANEALKDMESTSLQVAKNDSLIQALSKAKEGSVEYLKIIKELEKENPSLVDANMTAATSYVEVAKKVAEVNRQLRYKKALEAEQANRKSTETASKWTRQIEQGSTGSTRAQVDPAKAAEEAIALRFPNLQKIVPDPDNFGETMVNPEWKKRLELELLTNLKQVEAAGEEARAKYLAAMTEAERNVLVLAGQAGQLARETGRSEEDFLKSLKGMSDEMKQKALTEFRTALEGKNSYSTAVDERVNRPGGGGGGGKTANYYDIEKLRQQEMLASLEGVARKRKEINLEYQNELKKINESDFKSDVERQEAKALIATKQVRDLAELERKTNLETINLMIEGANTGISAITSAINGDAKSVATTVGDTIGKAFGLTGVGSLIGGVIGLGEAIVGVFTDTGKTAAEKFQESWDSVMSNWDIAVSASSALDKLYGPDSAMSLTAGREGLGGERYALDSMLMALGFSSEEAMSVSTEKIAEMIVKSRDLLARQIRLGGKDSPAALLEQERLNALEVAGAAMVSYNEKKMKSVLVENRDKLKKIQHEISTGTLNENDTLAEQVSIYDDMIASLQGVAGAEQMINDLEEERFGIQQRIIANNKAEEERLKGLAVADKYKGGGLPDSLSKLAKLRADIESGALRGGTLPVLMAEQTLLQNIIGSLKAQGASAEEIAPFATQLANLAKSGLGDRGFAAASGSGSAVTIPNLPSFGMGSSSITNSTTNQFMVNGQAISLPDNLWQLIGETVTRQTGRQLVA